MVLLNNNAYESGIAEIRSLTGVFYKACQSKLYSNAFYLMLNNIATSLLGFIFWNLMARYFSPAQVGIGSALVAASNLVAVLANMGLGVGLVRFVPEAGKKAGSLINSSFTLAGLVSLAGSALYLYGIKYWSPALGFISQDLMFLTLFIIFTSCTSLSMIADQALIAGRSARFVFYKNTANSIIKLPLPILAFTLLGGYGIFTGTGIGFLAGALLALFIFLPSVYKGYTPRPAYNSGLMRKVLPYSIANYMGNLLNMAPQFVYPLMILNILGAEKSAYFYIAWMMTLVLAVIPNGMAQSLFAEGSHSPEKLRREGKKILLLALAITTPAVGVMALLGGWLLHFFGAGYAENGALTMRFLAVAIIPQCVNSLFMTVNQVRKKIILIIAQTGMISLIALGLGYWLLGRVGLAGVGIAYTLAHLIVAMIVIWPLWRALREQSSTVKDPTQI